MVFPNVSNEANAYRTDARREWDEVTSGASESGRLPQAGSPQGCDHIGLLHKSPTRACEPATLYVPQWQALGTAILLSPGLSTLKSGKVRATVRNWHPRTSVSEAESGSPGPPLRATMPPT